MHGVFPVAIDQLELDHVRAFLQAADEEGVTWEAKADAPASDQQLLRPTSICKAACALANQIGGYLLIGATRRGQGWALPGIESRGDEPRLWVSQVLSDGLLPVPRFEPRAWTLDDGRWVIVVEVHPVDESPCMTAQGAVYERVSSESRPVQDPSRLAELFQRGQQARGRAETFAQRACVSALRTAGRENERCVGVAIAVAPIGREDDDVSARLFVPSFRSELVEAARQANPWGDPTGAGISVDQHAIAYVLDFVQQVGSFDMLQNATWLLQGTWDGAIVAAAALAPSFIGALSVVEEVIKPGWTAGVRLAQVLGGYGPAHLSVLVDVPSRRLPPPVPDQLHMRNPPPPSPPQGSLFAGLPDRTVISRWIELRAPSESEIGSVHRELQRAAGTASYEPEP